MEICPIARAMARLGHEDAGNALLRPVTPNALGSSCDHEMTAYDALYPVWLQTTTEHLVARMPKRLHSWVWSLRCPYLVRWIHQGIGRKEAVGVVQVTGGYRAASPGAPRTPIVNLKPELRP